MSKSQPMPSRPHSAASSTRSGTPSTKGRFFRPVPYSTTLALQQLMDGGSNMSHATRPTPMQRGSTSASRSRYVTPSSASTRRDQVWLDWEEKQEFEALMSDQDETETSWVDFQQQQGRESDEESAERAHDPPPRQILEAFSFQEQLPSARLRGEQDDEIPPDQRTIRPKGKARIRRVKTSESLRAGSAPLVIPPVPSAHHTNKADPTAVQEFVAASFQPPTFNPDDEGTSRLAKRGSISIKGFARKLMGRK
ncbi:SubName: Full=Uncharacterized protein {ECO:0000313/EMBL:CCA69160.1} [Serendipita indica DSM 11827]|nr:SubName: Full=Uncharacterized protein {ECO:0000313/EMBL:CCA69160.1} [Serendipita indica DSM 11827]